MQDILQKIKNPPNPPRIGDAFLKPASDEMLVYDGDKWVTCHQPFNEISENYFRKKFEEESEEIHKHNPHLKELWDEYKLLRRLSTGR